jgi:DNA repair ATPase RecN
MSAATGQAASMVSVEWHVLLVSHQPHVEVMAHSPQFVMVWQKSKQLWPSTRMPLVASSWSTPTNSISLVVGL